MEPQFEVAYTDRHGTRLQIFSETLETIVQYTSIHGRRAVDIVSRFNRDVRYTIVDGELIPAESARKWLSPRTCRPGPPRGNPSAPSPTATDWAALHLSKQE